MVAVKEKHWHHLPLIYENTPSDMSACFTLATLLHSACKIFFFARERHLADTDNS